MKLIAAIFFYAMFIAAVVGAMIRCTGTEGTNVKAPGGLEEVRIETSRGPYWCFRDEYFVRTGGLHCEPW